jgi:ABC-2 type transport system ATP-binding protein
MSIKLSNISKYYGTQAALKSISFEVERGQIVGFIGPNGAGKSASFLPVRGRCGLTG